MNKNILKAEIQTYIKLNLKNNIQKLILKGSPFSEVRNLELINQIESKNKSKNKLPKWFNTENIYYFSKLSIEQTSSEITAKYKSGLIKGKTLIDITGGFGVDTFYFSKQIEEVTHCEIQSELSQIAKHNFNTLGANNIIIINIDGISYLTNTNKKYDIVYIDPSRRNDEKGKVFLLNDCLPNVPENLELLFSKTNTVLIKNSPILDITSTINELSFVKEIHIVAVNNEVKELLFLLEKDYLSSISVKTININKNKVSENFDFVYGEKVKAIYSDPLNYIYEPNSAILKSGCFNHLCSAYKVNKLDVNSHLYSSIDLVNFPGRRFKVLHVLSYDKKVLKKYLPDNKANITVRNFPKSVAQIRKETKIKDGGSIYLLFTKSVTKGYIVILCSKI